MIAIIVDKEADKAPHAERLIADGYSGGEVEDLYVKGRDEVCILPRSVLHGRNAMYLDFMPQIACNLTVLELKMVDYIRLRHLSDISIQTSPEEPILAQLFA